MRRVASIALACVALGLAACGDSGDDSAQPTSATTIGSGATCRARLTETVTPEYLRQRGIGVANEQAAQQQFATAIAKVCEQGPATLPRNKGAERVVQVINEEFLTPQQ
jgi:hypothetical protein